MAAPMTNVSDENSSPSFGDFCTVEATVTTGFEEVAKCEAEEKLNCPAKGLNGKIRINCPYEKVEQILELGCVDNCRVVLHHVPDFKFTDDKNDNLQRLRNLVGSVDWPSGIQTWKRFFSFEQPIAEVPSPIPTDFGEVIIPPPRKQQEGPKKKRKKHNDWKRYREEKKAAQQLETNKESSDQALEGNEQESHSVKNNGTETIAEPSNAANDGTIGDINLNAESLESEEIEEVKKPEKNPWDDSKPSFRVTCNRHGDNHNFDSMTAASNFGGAVYRYFGWNVKMKEFDIEVVLLIDDQEVTVCIGLTKESLHRRNIAHFGRTTLKPTVAYNMLRLCKVDAGDIVCDPMCGSGSIPIQSAVGWPQSYHLCGEIAKKSIWLTKDNIDFMDKKRQEEKMKCLSVDPVRWDVCNLPVRDKSIDVCITDLPFGLRVGRREDNWTLYKEALLEMARVVKPETGRACLLTQDKKCMIQTLQPLAKYWRRSTTLSINLGGLAVGVYLLHRTATCYNNTALTLLPDKDSTNINTRLLALTQVTEYFAGKQNL